MKKYWLRGGVVGMVLFFVLLGSFFVIGSVSDTNGIYPKYESILRIMERAMDPIQLMSLLLPQGEGSPHGVSGGSVLGMGFVLLLEWLILGGIFGWLYGKIKNRKAAV